MSPKPVLNAKITDSDCSGESGIIDLSIDNINSNTEIKSCSWTGSNGYTNNVQDIFHLKPGEYTVTVEYGYGSNSIASISKTFKVKQKNNLDVKILETESAACEGDIIELATEINGGIDDRKYTWIITEGSETQNIQGNPTSFRAPVDCAGNKKVRLKVQSGVCKKKSKALNISIHKKIRTKPISHKR